MALIDRSKLNSLVSIAKQGVTNLVQEKRKLSEGNTYELEGELTPEQQEKGSKMLQVMDWAFDKAG